VIGIIGGSGVYEIEALRGARWQPVASPFGEPSSELLCGELEGVPVVFLPRHGRGHPIPPSDIDYRANIDALKRLGVTDLFSFSSCGSLREELRPGSFVIVDQFVDRTFARCKTFFGPGLAAHVSMARPVCGRLSDRLAKAADEVGISCVRGATYLAMEGPQFSTLAESNLYRSWGCDVLGMTNMPEAKLAREAEICYATLAMVTDYDCWKQEEASVTVTDVVRVLAENSGHARSLFTRLPRLLSERPAACPEGCDRALETAVITAPEARDPELCRKLEAVAGRVLGDR
jgi:5'-methylthioadenosine phosphorylase